MNTAPDLSNEDALILSFIDAVAELAADLWCEGKLDNLDEEE